VVAVKEWGKELYIYRSTPAPPKENDLQMYISNYLAQKEDKYISWFLHYYERTLNEKAMAIIQDYAMYGHFLDIKQAYVIGMLKALQDYDPERGVPFIVYKEYAAMREVHEYIRTMRTGFTVQSYDEYLRLRKAMRLYREFGNKIDDATMEKIAEVIGTSKEDATEIIRCGMQNMQFVEYYRQYADEDSEESREEVAHDGSSEPDKLFFKLEEAETVMTVFEKLNYRERAMISAHLGFCMECYATHFYDKDDLDEDGKPTRKPIPEEAFIDIAIDHGLASPDTADKIYRKALGKMKKELKKIRIDKI
jgi:DNA-directed RNA polymerase specialized sigma subunit